MKRENQGLCFIYLEEYTRVVTYPLMYKILEKGLNRSVVIYTPEEFARLYPWK